MTDSMRETRAIALASLVTGVLYFSGLFTILTPLPILYLSAVRGVRAGWISAALVVSAVSAVYLFMLPEAAQGEGGLSLMLVPGQGLAGFLSRETIAIGGVGYIVFFVAVALTMSWGASRKMDLMRWGGFALGVGLAVMATSLAAVLWFGPNELLGGVRSYIALVFAEVAKAGGEAGEGSAQLLFLAEHAEEVADYSLRLMPSLAFVYAVLVVAINMVLCRRMIRGHHAFSHVHNVARFRMPDALIWILIASGCLFFADSYVLGTGWLKVVALNGVIAIGSLYFLQGMAVIVYFLQGIRMPLIRTLAYVAMILFLQTVSVGLLLVGIADVWVDFRLRRWRALHNHS